MLFLISLAIKKQKTEVVEQENWPIYTILLPMYQETASLPFLIKAIGNLDYPKDKLDVKILIEADDLEMQEALSLMVLPRYFEIIKCMPSMPRTKPKVCNIGLARARGEYITIYDAEDIPASSQLKAAITKFNSLGPEYICLQARLNFYNYNENLLASLMSIEYYQLFEFSLPALQLLEIPIPLGGTSNHFKTEKLKELGGWNPYIVTEDAELGIRISKSGYKIQMLDSETLEESTITFKAWIKQRTRWIKGFIQTYLLHSKDIKSSIKQLKLPGFLGFQFFIGASVVSFVISPFVLLSWIAIDHNMIGPNFQKLLSINLGFAIFQPLLTSSIIAIIKRKNFLACFIYPVYFLLHIIAAFRAIFQLTHNPYLWEKTEHGLSKRYKEEFIT